MALPEADARDADEVQARAKDFGTVQADERRRINDETDRRFWKKLGEKGRQKLGRGRDQQRERELWMRTRDEVLQERQRVLDLPDRLQAFLEDGQGVAPENYRAALRIADLAKDFTDADWARYERNVGASSSDYEIVEESVRQFATRRAAEREVLDRVKETEAMFALWHLPARVAAPTPARGLAPAAQARGVAARTLGVQGQSRVRRRVRRLSEPVPRSCGRDHPVRVAHERRRSSTRSSPATATRRRSSRCSRNRRRLRPLVK